TRRAGEQQVIGRLTAQLGCLEHDRQVFFQLSLADELAEPSWSQTGLVDLFDIVGGRRIEELLTHVALPTGEGRRAADLPPTPTREARSSPRGSPRSHSRDPTVPRARCPHLFRCRSSTAGRASAG